MIKQEMNTLWTTGRGLYILLGLLFVGIFITPLMISLGWSDGIVFECIFALILISGVITIPCSKATKLGMWAVAVSAVAARVLDRFFHANFMIELADNALSALTLLAFAVLITKHFFAVKSSLLNRIVAAVALYLIIGVLWGRLYELVELTSPGSFTVSEQINPYTLLYFSFVTLVTIGYGDIVPLSTAARSLAILEGVVGQLYLVILISSLVSEFSSLKMKSFKEENND
jgi:hypothetical protein